MVKRYVPQRGDLIWLTFDPQTGHEQKGHRPAIVLSPDYYNRASGLALVCPITSQSKGYPFEVPVSQGKVKGVILSDQVKSLDWSVRRASFVARAADTTLSAVIENVAALLKD